MSTFEATQGMRVQRHFEVLEIDLPVINSTCTIGSSNGYGTPLTCDQQWTGEYKTYYFTNENAPVLKSINGEPIYRLILNIKETSTELKPGDGLSSRGSLSVTLSDINNQDPNINAPGVDDQVKMQGTYLGKLNERQIFENKDVRLKLYRIEPDGSIDLENGAQIRRYVSNAFRLNASTGNWTLECKDVISLANLDEKTWPIAEGSFLRQDIDESVTSIPVDGDTDYSSSFAVRVGDEFMEVISVTDNLQPTASLNVNPRGSTIFAPVSGELLTSTSSESHNGGDEVFICKLSDNETIDSLITRVLVDSDFDASLIPAAEWAAEVQEWHANDKINTLHSESESVNSVLKRILTGFLMDLWFSTTENKAKLSAISVWKKSSANLIEGKEINSYSIKKQPKDQIRASRAFVAYDKRNLSSNNDVSSFKKASRFSDNTLVSPALYGKHKDKAFDNNFLLNKDSADLLVQRYVSRFKFTPFVRTWQTEERYLTFNVGDVVDIITSSDQSPSGLPSGDLRAQIIKINPKYTNTGRTYDITAMTYEAAFNDNSEIVLDSPLSEVNLYILAGAPSSPVTLTFVLDGTYSQGGTSIRAGEFATGSKLIIILANGFNGQANGGNGGDGEGIFYDQESGMPITFPPSNGGNGGIVYDAQGVDTDIYFSGSTPSVSYPVADGYIRSPSGGDGGFNHTGSFPLYTSGNGGDGGDGRTSGIGGDFGLSGDNSQPGEAGKNGEIDGSGSGWGNDGVNNDATGGLAGSGIKDNGAIVNLFGSTPTRYINGNGDHP